MVRPPLSAILVLAALLRGDSDVVFSNERSASYGSAIPGTGEVNHQWSKGWDFERRFGEYVEGFAPVRYWSLLRPLSELAVARQFARSDRYDAHFSSCNRNFHILGPRPASRCASTSGGAVTSSTVRPGNRACASASTARRWAGHMAALR